MKKTLNRRFFEFISVIALAVLVFSAPGIGTQVAYALTTTVTETVPPGTVTIPQLACTNRTLTVNPPPTNIIISDVNLGVNIAHPRRSDVRVTLESPEGTLVVLISGAGLGNPVASPDDYDNYDVLLDDSSINSLYDNDNDDATAPTPPYSRDAKPTDALTAFIGENAVGDWTLSICDQRSGEVGTYNSAQLIITAADPDTVSGVVFTDYNDNGFRDQGDVGVPNVTVRAYDTSGSEVLGSPVQTDANGNYTFTGLAFADGTQLRIEFSNIPAGLRPGAFGPHSGTTVQFVTSPAAGVDMGLVDPGEYCQANPFIVSPCYKNGEPTAADIAGETVLLSIPYDAYGRQDANIENPLAEADEIGATWGLGFQRSTGMLFAGALAKRHVGLGPDGTGAIYSLVLNPGDGTGTTPSLFLDLADFGIPTDLNPIPLGSNASRNLSTASDQPSTDPTAWDAVGKVAIGDVDMGSDDSHLWVMNLANQTLYRIDVGNPATPPTSISDFDAFPVVLPGNAPGCLANDVRPWAVEIHQGDVYVGVVCSAQTSELVSDLRAYILRIPEGAAVGTAFTLVTEFSLNYPRGNVTNPSVYVGNTQPSVPAEWRPWASSMIAMCDNPCTGVGDLAFGKQLIYPQPILSDIEFDTNGDLILGFMDRLGHQTGNFNYATSNPWNATLYNHQTNSVITGVTMPTGQVFEGVSAGDTIRMCSNGVGGFDLETNASCGAIITGGAGNGQGPGAPGGEYYWQDMFVDPTSIGATGLGATTDPNAGTHHEISLGGLLLIPGTNEIAVSIFDPFDVRAGGIAWFNNQTGTRSRAYEVFTRDQGSLATTFGKAAGLGDIEGFCMNAPIEIGNRVWFDTDNDGIQDADETPIEGVTVELWEPNGTSPIATVVTDVNGNYFFSSGPGTDRPNQDYLINGFGPNSQFEVRIPLGQLALAGLTLTTNDANNNNEDQRDSDGQDNNAGAAAVAVQTLGPGNNNHTYDFGFTATYSLGNRVWLDDGTGGGLVNNGIQDGGEVGIDDVEIHLYLDDGTTPGVFDANDTFQSFQITANGGYYRFDDLMAGDYIVNIPAFNFNVGNALFNLDSSLPDELSPNDDTDINDNGIGTAHDVLTGISSNAVTLGPGTSEPLAGAPPAVPGIEVDVPLGQGAPDDRANMTVDFGFVPLYSIGNRVWFDTDNDELRDDGVEVGVDGVEVELYATDASGNPIGVALATTITDNGGYYRFDGLAAGNYVVVITEDNFIENGVNDELVGYWSSGTTISNAGVISETTAELADSDIDDDDNGTLQNAGAFPGAVVSSIVTLGPGLSEPVVGITPGVPGIEVDVPLGQGAIDERANMTVDFGFYRLELGNLVFRDVNNDGFFTQGTDLPLPNVLVQLFAADGTTEIITGADGIRGTADDGLGPDGVVSPDDGTGGIFTDFNGNYLFSGLPQGNYVVKATGPVGYTSTIDNGSPQMQDDNDTPDDNVDNNDNGDGTGAGLTTSAVIALTPGSPGALNNNTVTQSNGTTRNPTMDFGFVLAGADILKTVSPPVATIGEVVTYQVQIVVPPGTFTDAILTDAMDEGLALFECVSVAASSQNLTTTVNGGFAAMCTPPNVSTAPATGVNIDRVVIFDFDTLENNGQTDETITITYSAIVLDIASNVGAATQTTLNNSAEWTWSGPTLPRVETTITLVEPELQIVKSSNTNFVATGTDVEFTLTVTHTANSQADAFDVVITDVLPAELDINLATLDCDAGTFPATTCGYDPGTRTVSGSWDTFPRLPAGNLIIRFTVTGNALLAPNQTITNVGNVQWTSLPIDQTTPDSFSTNPPNPFATERFYDPASSINTYGDSDPLVLNPVGGGGGGGGTSPTSRIGGFLIPVTGFAPGRQTLLDERSALYTPTTLAFEIPAIKVKSTIAGVQLKDGNWDVSWLQDQAGWLEGTAYPTWSGNSVLTAHTVNADGKPGLFYRLKYLRSGDYIFVYNSGYRYTYKVVSNEYVQPDDISVLQHEDSSTITLITCDRYDIKTGTYLRRVVVRAVLVDVSLVK